MERLLETASPVQSAVINFLNLPAFDNIMGMVIVFNMVVMIVETDRVANEAESAGHWTEICGWGILGIFVVELGLRLFAFRCLFWHDAWNVFDFAVVVVDGVFSLLGLVVGSLFPISILRILRLAKLARISKVLRVFPELRIMVAGLAGSVSAIFWGFVLLCLLVLVWSIVAVQFIHPWNKELEHLDECPRCQRAFASVLESAMTIWQTVIAGDNWGQTAIPIMEAHPASAFFFLGVCVSVGMGVLNLILGVVCNVFTLAHDRIEAEIVLEERVAKLETQQHLRRICESLDETGSGELTQEQMRVGFDTHADFHQVMDTLEVSSDDLEIVWTIIDTEKSGAVSYQKFVDQVYLMKDNDTHFMLAYIKYYITKIKETLMTEIQSNKESKQKSAELAEMMVKEIGAEELQVEETKLLMKSIDKKVTDIEVVMADHVTNDDVAAISALASSMENQSLTNGSLLQEKTYGHGAQSQAPSTVDKGIFDTSQQLRRRLQSAASEIHCSLDKHISEINVLIDGMMPAKIKAAL